MNSLYEAAKMVHQDFKAETMNHNKQPIELATILLLGDPGVGKTSLLYSLLNDDFDPTKILPARLDDVQISAKITLDNVAMKIIDYSIREHSQDDLNNLIKLADVICMVCVAGDIGQLHRVVDYWLPIIRLCHEDELTFPPLLLVENKSDLLIKPNRAHDIAIRRLLLADVVTSIETSAVYQENVVELFSAAQKSYKYPPAPLFDSKLRSLRENCRDALTEIFKKSDLNHDGLLDDNELNRFHDHCFGTPIQKDALNDLKSIMKQSAVDGMLNDSVTLAGFLFLHELSIEKGRLNFTWETLRSYGYDKKMMLNLVRPQIHVEDSIADITNRSSRLRISNDSNHDPTPSVSVRNIKSGRELLNPLDISWLRDRPLMIKAGIGLTFATIFSFVAMRLLTKGSTS